MKILQLIRQAFSKAPGKDDTPYPTGTCKYNGKEATFIRLLPYGLSSLEPAGTFILLANSQGQEAVKFGIPSAMTNRLKNLSEGEVALYNSVTGVYILIRADDSIEINSDTMIDGNVSINGNLNVSGTLSVTGAATMSTITCDAITINGLSFGSHVHGGVDTGTGTSDGPQ